MGAADAIAHVCRSYAKDETAQAQSSRCYGAWKEEEKEMKKSPLKSKTPLRPKKPMNRKSAKQRLVDQQDVKDSLASYFNSMGICQLCMSEKGCENHHVFCKNTHSKLRHAKQNHMWVSRACHNRIHNETGMLDIAYMQRHRPEDLAWLQKQIQQGA